MKKIVAVALTLIAAIPFTVRAQTVEQDGPKDNYSLSAEHAQAVFLQYQMAMDAEAQCRKTAFSADDLLAMNKAAADQMVAEAADATLGAARLLNLRRKAEDDTDSLISREGCDGQKVKKSLAFFDERLANVHPAESDAPPNAGLAMDNAGDNADALRPVSGQAPGSGAPATLTPPPTLSPATGMIIDRPAASGPSAPPSADDQVPGTGAPVVLTPTTP